MSSVSAGPSGAGAPVKERVGDGWPAAAARARWPRSSRHGSSPARHGVLDAERHEPAVVGAQCQVRPSIVSRGAPSRT
jgi:hypothetical protein